MTWALPTADPWLRPAPPTSCPPPVRRVIGDDEYEAGERRIEVEQVRRLHEGAGI